MLYNNLLFFLGFYSWNYKSSNLFEKIFQKRQINQTPMEQLKNNKLIRPRLKYMGELDRKYNDITERK